jgi:hypothetical protein
MNTVELSLPAITKILLSKGRKTIGHETNLSRSPLWNARQRSAPESTVVSPMLYGHAFRQVEGHSLTTADQRLFAYLTTAFVRAGCPADRRVPFSLGDAALALGHADLGGKQRALVRGSLARLRSVTIESAVRHPDGHETVLGWGLVDSYLVTTGGLSTGWIVLGEPVSHLLAEGSVTFLHAPTWEAICAQDEVAGRLWSFLESENIRHGWKYAIFPPTDGCLTTASVPSVSDVLMLHWASRRKVAQRVREACAVIATHDSRYHLEVSPAKNPGDWNLVCSWSQQLVPKPSRDGLPDLVVNAWRKAYRSQLPSVRQRGILGELLTRHSPERVAENLYQASAAGHDPFHCLLEHDRLASDERLAAAKEAEERWQETKQRESAEAEQSLADLIAVIGRPARTA